MSFKYQYECPKCDTRHEFKIWEGSPGTYWEPPEHPESEGPDKCDKCGAEFDYETVINAALESRRDYDE